MSLSPGNPQAALNELMIEIFSASELRRWLRHGPYNDVVARLPGETASMTALVDHLTDTLERHGRIDQAFFERLTAKVPSKARAIRSVAERWRLAPVAYEDNDPSHAALVLDRTRQWQHLRECCTDDNRHLIIFIEGDHEQDIDLFLKRIKLFFKDECSRRHAFFAIPRTQEHSQAITAADWERRICAKSRVRSSLADALASAARDLDALYVLEDYGHALKGLTWPDFEGLIDLFQKLLPPALARRPPAHSLRFVVPIQHDPQHAKATRKYLRETLNTLKRVQGLATIPVPKLTLPRATDFEHLATDLLGPLSKPEQRELRALYKTLTDRKKSPLQSYRTLGEALQEFIDSTAEARHRRST